MDLKVVKEVVLRDSHLNFDLTQLLAVGESLLCDYPMVTDYILVINLTKRKKIYSLLMVLSNQNWCQRDIFRGVSNNEKHPIFVVHNGYRALLTIALMPIKQYTVFRWFLQLSEKYWFNQFYKTLFFTIHALNLQRKKRKKKKKNMHHMLIQRTNFACSIVSLDIC